MDTRPWLGAAIPRKRGNDRHAQSLTWRLINPRSRNHGETWGTRCKSIPEMGSAPLFVVADGSRRVRLLMVDQTRPKSRNFERDLGRVFVCHTFMKGNSGAAQTAAPLSSCKLKIKNPLKHPRSHAKKSSTSTRSVSILQGTRATSWRPSSWPRPPA